MRTGCRCAVPSSACGIAVVAKSYTNATQETKTLKAFGKVLHPARFRQTFLPPHHIQLYQYEPICAVLWQEEERCTSPAPPCCLPHRFADNARRWRLATARKERESSRSTEGRWHSSRCAPCSFFCIQASHCISFCECLSLSFVFASIIAITLSCPRAHPRLQPPTLRAKLVEPIAVLGLQVALAPGTPSFAQSPLFILSLSVMFWLFILSLSVMFWHHSTLSDVVVQLQGVNRFADVDIRIKVRDSSHMPRFNSTIENCITLSPLINQSPPSSRLPRPPAATPYRSHSHVALRSPEVARSLRSTQSVRPSPRASSRTLHSRHASC